MLTWAFVRFFDKHPLPKDGPGLVFLLSMGCDVAIFYNISNIGWAFKCLK